MSKIGTALKRFFLPKALTKSQEQKWLEAIADGAGNTSSSGIRVSRDSAMKIAAVYSCVKIISNQIAQLPMCVYRNTGNGRIRVKDHPVDNLIHNQYNEYTIQYYGIRPAIVNLLLTGSGYIMIERKNGAPTALWPIDTKRVTKQINKHNKPRYIIDFSQEGKGKVIVSYTDMIELQGISTDGIQAYDPIKLFADILGLLKAEETYSAEYFKNAVKPSGVVEIPTAMEEDVYKRFKKSINEAHAGLGNQHKIILLEEGAKFAKISAPPEEGQTIEARKFQILEVARVFNVPPSKIMDYDRATWGNLEEVNLQFLNDCLMEYIKPIEQSFGMQLLTEEEKKNGYYIEFNLSGLLRGKQAERYRAYAQSRQWGFLSVNEIREMENMSNIGKQGDIYLTPANMIDSKKIGGDE